jgi:hypothetical protein
MNDTLLLDRLNRLRRQIRLFLLVDGLGEIMAFTAGAGLLAIALDYLFVLPPAVRLIATLVGALMWLALVWRRAVRPMITRIELAEIAAVLDHRFTELEDRLASAVGFLGAPPTGSAGMIRRVISQADEAAARLPLDSVLHRRRPASAIAAAILLGAATVSLGWGLPWFLRTGIHRYAMPFGPTEWPRRVLIDPLTGHAKRPIGEWFEARARVSRGQSPSLRVYVHTETKEGRHDQYVMAYDAGTDQYLHTLSGLQEDFSYWFEAGDDSTADRCGRFHVTVVPRPVVLSAEIELTDPPYMGTASPRRLVLQESPVSAVEGSRARLAVLINKAVAKDAQGQPRANLTLPGGPSAAGAPVPMEAVGHSDRRFGASFEARQSGTLTVQVVDEDGFDNRGGTSYPLTVRPDEPPHAVIVEPQAVTEVTPSAAVAMVIAADDDFGLTRLTLRATVDRLGPDRPTVFDLTDRMKPARTGGRRIATVNWTWDLRAMELKPGDGVTYTATVTDNFDLGGRRHAPVVSPEMRLKVISSDQFTDRIREELLLLKGAIRQMLAAQEAAGDQTQTARSELDKGKSLNDRDLEVLAQTLSRQAQLASRATYLGGRFSQLIRRMDANQSKDPDVRQHSAEASRKLGALAAGSMVQAAEALQRAGQAKAQPDQRKALAEAETAQQTSADQLRSLLAGMDRWGDFQDIVRQTQHLLDQQQTQTESTQRLSQRTIGQRPEDLSPQLSAELRQQTRQQGQLVEDAVRLKENMTRLAEALRKTDPAAAATMDEARAIADASQLQRKLNEAASAIAGNRMAQAQADQRTAEDTIRNMLAALERRETQELAVLDKQLQGAVQKLQSILQDQQKLLEQTGQMKTSPGDALRFDDLARRQEGLSRSTGAVGNEVAKVNRSDRPARGIQRAADRMNRAAGQLRQRQADGASSEQTEAVRQLQESLEELRKLGAQTAAEMAARSLQATAEEMKKLRDNQARINEQLKGLLQTKSKGQELSRAEFRRMDKMADQERQTGGDLERLRSRMQTAPVYDWVMKQIRGDMGNLARRFDQRLVDSETGERAESILQRLNHLLTGLDQKPTESEESRFADGSGSGQSGGAAKIKAVPTAAELAVLRALQSDLNQRTQELDFKGNLAGRQTERRLEDVRRLGKEQEQIRNLTEEVYRRAMR